MQTKQYLPKLKPLTTNLLQWEAFCDMLDFNIEDQQRKLEQAVDMSDVYKAQGAIAILRRLKYLRDEVNGKQ
jgi:hypothetical protein